MKKKTWKIVLLSMLSVVVLLGAVIGGFMIYSANFRVPEPAQQVENTRFCCRKAG